MTQPTPPYGFATRPEPKSLGSATRGRGMVDGTLRLSGGSLSGDVFAQTPPNEDYAAALHGFGWLDHLAAVANAAARDLAQQRVLEWIAANPAPDDSIAWRADVTGRRLTRWLFHAGTILPGLDRDAAQPVFDSMHLQLAHLKAVQAEQGKPRIEALAGRAIAAMLLRDAAEPAAQALAALAESIEPAIHQGVLRARCPEELLSCLALLGWVKSVAEDSGHAVPQPILDSIEDIAPILRALRHADGGLPRFHGGGRGVPGRLDHSLRAASGPAVTAPGHPMGFARLARLRTTVIMDAAPPPAGPAAAHAHASTLGIELTSARHPIVVSCGSGKMFGPAWARASRATACHSTLSLSGLSSAKLLPADASGHERLTLLPQQVWAGACDAEGNLLPRDAPQPASHLPAQILAGHDAWQGSHGLTHLRELQLAAMGDELAGEDTLAALDTAGQQRLDELLTDAPDGIPFDIRFHLHPEVVAELHGDSVWLTVPGGETWSFDHDLVAVLALEPSAWLESGMAEPQPTQQIVLSYLMASHAVQIGWTFKRVAAS